jgi:hypothetical protein
MGLQEVSPQPIAESTTSGRSTPTESITSSISDTADIVQTISSAVPWPGSSFIIRAAGSASVLTLRDGQVVLGSPGGRGDIYWECVERNGWLGFRAPASGLYLGHDMLGRLCCGAKKHQAWENFCARLRPEGGYVLLMSHWEKLWPLGVKEVDGGKVLEKVQSSVNDGAVWDFVKVQ